MGIVTGLLRAYEDKVKLPRVGHITGGYNWRVGHFSRVRSGSLDSRPFAFAFPRSTVGINLGGNAPITLTYDAFDRIVEENNAGTYKQILYSTMGKLALMAKQVANNVFLPLPGGEQAIYTNGTIRFRHYDWLGSARFESTMGEAEYGDLAYAPFAIWLPSPWCGLTAYPHKSLGANAYRKYNCCGRPPLADSYFGGYQIANQRS